MNIKNIALRAFSTALAVTGLACALPLHAQTIIFADNFENAATIGTGDLNGKPTSDGNATYSVSKMNSVFQSRASSEDKTIAGLGSYVGQIYANPSTQSTWIAVSTNLDATPNYTFKIGYLLYAGSGQFGINARSNTQNASGSFQLTWSGSTASFAYIDSQGVSTSLGTIIATPSEKASSFYLRDIVVTVIGNTQQLSVNGVTLGSIVATQGTFSDSATDQIRFYGISSSSAVDIRMDNLVVTAIPESSVTAGLFSVTTLIAALVFLAKRRR